MRTIEAAWSLAFLTKQLFNEIAWEPDKAPWLNPELQRTSTPRPIRAWCTNYGRTHMSSASLQ